MFKLADENTTYDYPVTVRVPAAGGRAQEQTFTAHFRLLPADEVRQMTDDGSSNKDFLKRILAGWDGIHDAKGKALPYNASNLEKLANINYFTTAVGQAYAAFAMGLPAKNSKPPRGH
ncbi:MAG: hypothetical protein OXU98_05430 [Gammaproteobacteria bacterium]|nr:hypothetical protein [Gammaproteobacteria bacterium]